MVDPDLDCLKLVGQGDRAALEMLYRRYVDRVWRYAWHTTHSREQANDIAQETFLRIARSAHQFEGRAQVATWIFALARSTAIAYARREKRHRQPIDPASALRLVADDSPQPQSHEETAESVRSAVATLPGAQRDVVVLCDVSGMSTRDVAHTLGWGESRVKVTLFRARRALRKLLSGKGIGKEIRESG